MHDAVTVILTKPTGEILMQLRDDGNGKSIEYPNMWCFFTGGMDAGESYLEAAVREMKEELELNLDPSKLKLLWTYTHDQTENDYVLVGMVSSDVKPVLHEGADMRWMKLDEIKETPLAFEKDRVIPYIEAYFKTEGFKALT